MDAMYAATVFRNICERRFGFSENGNPGKIYIPDAGCDEIRLEFRLNGSVEEIELESDGMTCMHPFQGRQALKAILGDMEKEYNIRPYKIAFVTHGKNGEDGKGEKVPVQGETCLT